MKFLADACCDALIVRTLRALGHEVAFVAEFAPSTADEDVLAQAFEEQRILITEGRDFCRLVFRDVRPAYGVVLVRIPARHRIRKADRITTLVNDYAARLPGAMTTLTLPSIRIRPLPSEKEQ